MKKIILAILLIIIYIKVNCQDSCIVVYSLRENSLDTTHIISDNNFKVKYKNKYFSLKGHNFYLNKKCIIGLKNVNYYEEIAVVDINNILYFFVYPIYKGNGGPYICTLGNGILIIIENGKKIRILRNVDCLDRYGLCRDIIEYLNEKRLIKHKFKNN